MDTLPESEILEFYPNTIYNVRKELNLHQKGTMEGIIKNFEDWVQKQPHFTKKNFSHHYLETSILNAKGSLERAKKTLDKMCTLKTLLPQYFNKHDLTETLDVTNKYVIHATLPKATKDYYRIYFIKVVSSDFISDIVIDFYRFTTVVSEYLKVHDYSLGFVVIFDCSDVNLLNLISKINVVDLRNNVSILLEGYGFRVKGIHFITPSKTIDVLMSIVKQIFSAKMASRIHVHNTIESVYDYVPLELLPKDYGGGQKSLLEVCELWKKAAFSKEGVEYLKDICNAGTNEKLRLTTSYNEQVLGMPGSFRVLTVD